MYEFYAILSLPRAGGHLLGELLGQHNCLNFKGEYFHRVHHGKRYNAVMSGRYEEAVSSLSSNDLVLLHTQFGHNEYGFNDPNLISRQFIEKLDPQKTVVLYRQDLIAQLVSLKAAWITSTWAVEAKAGIASDRMLVSHYNKLPGKVKVKIGKEELLNVLDRAPDFPWNMKPFTMHFPICMEELTRSKVRIAKRILDCWGFDLNGYEPLESLVPLSKKVKYQIENIGQVRNWIEEADYDYKLDSYL